MAEKSKNIPLEKYIAAGAYHAVRGDFNTALDIFTKAVEEYPNNSLSHFNRSGALYELNFFHAAMVELDIAISLDPSNFKAHIAKGTFLHNHDKNKEALKEYDKALAIDPNNIDATFLRTVSLFRLERFSEAEKSKEKLVELTKNGGENGEAYFDRYLQKKPQNEPEPIVIEIPLERLIKLARKAESN
jgi:tetratricopeptide (TPR) repeat protein